MIRLLFTGFSALWVALLLASCDAADLSNPSIYGSLNGAWEFTMSDRKNETGHYITDFSLTQSSPDLPKNWKTDVKYGVSDNDGVQTFTLLGNIVANPPVPDGYQLYPGVGYYKFNNTRVTFDEALGMCAAEGSHLAIINSDAESEVMAALFKADDDPGSWAWLGFDDQLVEGEFVTIFGQPLNSSGFYTWYSPEEPNGGTRENCGTASTNGLLNDENCGCEISFICEFDLSWADN
ncbi:hemolymph lipopolysaccharide-binding protein-like [Ischnura elegans]|nr:hemolymph lipopolysaccharide-binding protein-like [Ischnura elegans]